jgi:hypothetical protein
MRMVSRRDLFRSTVPLTAMLVARKLTAAPSLRLSLAQKFDNSIAVAFSPDGLKICLEDWASPGYPLRVVEFGTWKTIYTGRFRSRLLATSFFADSKALFLQFPPRAGANENLETVVDLGTGARTEQMRPHDYFRESESIYPVRDRTLLAAHYGTKPYRLEWLSKVELPGYRELGRALLPLQVSDSIPMAGLTISADKNTAVHFFDNAVVCVRIEDLSVLWTRPVELGLRAYHLDVTADGSFVAAAISDNGFSNQQRKYSVIVYNGRTGGEVTRLRISGTDGLALSPDGKLIAVVDLEPGKKGEILPTVHIHEVSSGKRLASVVHDQIKSGRRQFLESGCTVAFTADGRYIVTSGMVTKVWWIEIA